MRYQERIYIQNDNCAVRNKDILNVNMSSDMCIFEAPSFNVSGATKIDCPTGATGTTLSSGATGVYIITTATTIPLTFDFTANTNTFTATNATFYYEVYKYDQLNGVFPVPAVFVSDPIQYSAFSATNSTTELVQVSDINIDGDYLVKVYYIFDACTDFLNRLGKTIDTVIYRNGRSYGIYDPDLDYYFVALTPAQIPIFASNGSNTPSAGQLFQQIILPAAGQTDIVISSSYEGAFVVTLNGLVLANEYDYTYTGSVVTLSSATVSDDIITIIYTTVGGNNLVGDNISISGSVVSGTTGNQGSNSAYFNTTTGKYEIYTEATPVSGGAILVMINGATLASGIDYYQSSSNPKRIILEGGLMIGDIITIIYFPVTDVINGLITNTPVITWTIPIAPQLVNGEFILEVSTGSTFTTFYATGSTPYEVGQTVYSDSFTASGTVGTVLYYRVKNIKDYVTICEQIIETIAYSETISVTIQTNAINTY
mgnify:CR=1 FL=1